MTEHDQNCRHFSLWSKSMVGLLVQKYLALHQCQDILNGDSSYRIFCYFRYK